jgi:hypothetical protein
LWNALPSSVSSTPSSLAKVKEFKTRFERRILSDCSSFSMPSPDCYDWNINFHSISFYWKLNLSS